MFQSSTNQTTFVDVTVSDRQPLFGGKSHRKCSNTFLSILVLGLVVVIGILMAGYSMYWNDVIGVRVMALNTWGMPHRIGSEDKEERMAAIGRLLSQSEYDIVMLEELWMRPDHETIKKSLGPEYQMTEYDDMTGSCDGKIWPWGCSGLAVISKFPFKQTNFSRYSQQGSFGQMLTDGEYFAGKGVGKVTISPKPGIVLDVYVTHTISEESNIKIRETQADELLDQVKKSTADFIILGGDFNASPISEGDKTYHKIKELMTDAFQEIMASIKAWLNPDYATFGHLRNTYTGGKRDPTIYDYIFHKKNTEDPSMIWTKWFFLPFLNTIRSTDNSTISLSDHEAVTSHIYLWKQTK